jgi:hypothetical protein
MPQRPGNFDAGPTGAEQEEAVKDYNLRLDPSQSSLRQELPSSGFWTTAGKAAVDALTAHFAPGAQTQFSGVPSNGGQRLAQALGGGAGSMPEWIAALLSMQAAMGGWQVPNVGRVGAAFNAVQGILEMGAAQVALGDGKGGPGSFFGGATMGAAFKAGELPAMLPLPAWGKAVAGLIGAGLAGAGLTKAQGGSDEQAVAMALLPVAMAGVHGGVAKALKAAYPEAKPWQIARIASKIESMPKPDLESLSRGGSGEAPGQSPAQPSGDPGRFTESDQLPMNPAKAEEVRSSLAGQSVTGEQPAPKETATPPVETARSSTPTPAEEGAKPPTPGGEAVKEPWQQTLNEYRDTHGAPKGTTGYINDKTFADHSAAVSDAIERGEVVPDGVLDRYPYMRDRMLAVQALKMEYGTNPDVLRNDSGMPLVVHRGVSGAETSYRPGGGGVIFFSSSLKVAKAFADMAELNGAKTSAVKSAVLRMHNPLVVTAPQGTEGGRNPSEIMQWIKQARSGGHDGLIIKGIYESGFKGDNYAVFSPDQVLSVPKPQASVNPPAAPGSTPSPDRPTGQQAPEVAPQAKEVRSSLAGQSVTGEQPAPKETATPPVETARSSTPTPGGEGVERARVHAEAVKSMGITDEQADAVLSVYDAIADHAVKVGKIGSRDDFYRDLSVRKATDQQTARAGAKQGDRAFIDIDGGTGVIRALKSADVSSLAHEMAHFARPLLAKWFPEDMKAVEGFLGVKDGDWQTGHEERFARSFERYLRDGKAPTPALTAAFSRLREWLSAIYQKITSGGLSLRGLQLTDAQLKAMKGIYDRFLGGGKPLQTILENARRGGDAKTARDQLADLRGRAGEHVKKYLSPDELAESQRERAGSEKAGGVELTASFGGKITGDVKDALRTEMTAAGRKVLTDERIAAYAKEKYGIRENVPGGVGEEAATADGRTGRQYLELLGKGDKGTMRSQDLDNAEMGASYAGDHKAQAEIQLAREMESHPDEPHPDLEAAIRDRTTSLQAETEGDIPGFGVSVADITAEHDALESKKSRTPEEEADLAAMRTVLSQASDGSKTLFQSAASAGADKGEEEEARDRDNPNILFQSKNDETPEEKSARVRSAARKMEYGIRNAQVDADRASRGEPPATHGQKRAWEMLKKQAAKATPEDKDRVMMKAMTPGVVMTDLDATIAAQYQVELGEKMQSAFDRYNKAKAAGARPEDLALADVEARAAEAKYRGLETAVTLGGTPTGQALAARAQMRKNDYSFAHQVATVSRAMGEKWEKMTEAERDGYRTKIKDATDRIKQLTDQVAEAHKQTEFHKAQAQFEQELRKKIEAAKGRPGGVIANPRDFTAAPKIKSMLDRMKAMQAAGTTLMQAAPGASGEPTLADVAHESLRFGTKEYPVWEKGMVDALGESVRPRLRAAWDEGQQRFLVERRQQIGQRAGARAAKSGMPDDIGLAARQIEDTFIKQGIHEREALVGAVHGALKEHIPDITRRETMDAMSGYGDYRPLSKDETSVIRRDVNGQLQLISQIEDWKSGEGAKKTGFERREVTEPQRQLAKERDAAKKASGYEGPDDEARLKSAMQTARTRMEHEIEDMDRQLATGKQDVRTARKTALTPEVEALKARRDELKAMYNEVFGNKTMTDEARLEAWKTRASDRLQSLDERIATGDFMPKPKPEPVKMDPEAQTLDLRIAEQKHVLDGMRRNAEFAARPMYQKVFGVLAQLRREFVLSSPAVFAKLSSAATCRVLSTPIEQLVGAVYSKMLPSLAAAAPREGGFSPRIEAQSWLEGYRHILSDIKTVWKPGHMDIDALFGKAHTSEEFQSFFGRIHEMMKTAPKRNEFFRSLRMRTEQAIRIGLDPSEPAVLTRLSVEAVKDANRSISLQDNWLTRRWSKFTLPEIDPKTGKETAGSSAVRMISKVALPIVKVPTNIVGETLNYVFGSLTGGGRAVGTLLSKHYAETIAADPVKADAIMRAMKKGTVGGVMLALGWTYAGSIGGYYQRGDNKDKEKIQSGGLKIDGLDVPRWLGGGPHGEIPRFLLHNPLLECLQLGATVRHIAEAHFSKKNPETKGMGAGVFGALTGLLGETPFLQGASNLAKSGETGGSEYLKKTGENLAVPQAVQWGARQFAPEGQPSAIDEFFGAKGKAPPKAKGGLLREPVK